MSAHSGLLRISNIDEIYDLHPLFLGIKVKALPVKNADKIMLETTAPILVIPDRKMLRQAY